MPDVPLALIQPSRDLLTDEARTLAAELKELIDGEVRFGRHDRMLYATDASIYQAEPVGVVIPRSIADVERTIAFAAEHDLTLLPRGGGTSLAGQTVNHALVIDLSKHLRHVLDVDPGGRRCRVEPGVVLDQLNRELEQHGLMFGPDVATAAYATIGGMIGNNSAGAHSILYGRTVEHLLGIDAMLADGRRLTFDQGAAERDPAVREITDQVAAVVRPIAGEIRERYPKTKRHVDGYNLDIILDQIEQSTAGTFDRVNLAHLLCGSEGTLAWTLEATLNLVEAPKRKGLAVVAYESVEQALHQLTTILETKPSAVELLDDVVLERARANVECRRYVEMMPEVESGRTGALFYVEYFADDDAGIERQFDALEQAAAPHAVKRFIDAGAMASAWQLRKSGEPLLHAVPGDRKPVTFIEDTAVDPDRLASFVQEFRDIVARHGTTAAYYAHASVGCLHIRPLVNLRDPDDLDVMESIVEEVTELVKRYDGALSGEHGDGRVRSPFLEQLYGRTICDAFRQIKAIFDPHDRMNPGIIARPAPELMRSRLRVKPDGGVVEFPDVDTFYRYEHGFREAVEQCNGAGVCRRLHPGTMCPSYRGTLDERHATRGRGNALRLAITGQLSLSGTRAPTWDDDETLETLDLCLSCKACKSECPSNVDIAKLKAEYHGQRYRHGARLPLSKRLVGEVRRLNRLGSAAHTITNALARYGPFRAILKRVMDVDPRRSLPEFGPSLYRWHRDREKDRGARLDAPAVVLLPDCFTTYNEPHVGRAAVDVLEALGYRVALPKLGCCGRSMISVGMMDRARETCAATARDLIQVVDELDAVAVVGAEPSCISAIKDEWLDLKMDVPYDKLKALAEKSFLVEGFIDTQWEDHPERPDVRPVEGRIVLHGHCHQKSLWGVETSAALLRRIAGDERVRVLDTGCCGMAGSFGYAPKRYDLSMTIAELSLLPAIRDEPDAIIAAPGTSCRHQIRDGVGRESVHPIEIAARAMIARPE